MPPPIPSPHWEEEEEEEESSEGEEFEVKSGMKAEMYYDGARITQHPQYGYQFEKGSFVLVIRPVLTADML